MLWVPNLTYIFRPHFSLFIVIFSTLTSSHHFFSGITYHHLWYSFSIFSLIIAYLTLSLFHLEWWFFTRHYMEDCHILSPCSPHGQWSRDLILRGCLVSEDSCYISTWGEFIHLAMYFMGDHSLLIKVCAKKKNLRNKKIRHFSVYHSPFSTCMDVLVCFIGFIC